MRRRSEVTRKSDAQIERETAWKWARRAVDSGKCYDATGDLKWLLRFEDYKHEALEHAALVQDCGKTACAVQKWMERECRAAKRKGKSRRRR